MYSIDGVPLKNPTYNWRLKFDNTNPYAGINRTLLDFNASGRDGTVQVRGYSATPTITLNITTPTQYVDDLKQLLRLGTTLSLTSDATKAIKCELVTAAVTPWTLAGGGILMVSAVLRLPEVYWRDVTLATTGPIAITSSGQNVTTFTASTAPVRDALITVGGSITGLSVAASNGTYFSYAPNIPAGTYLTFDSASGRAWTGTTAFAQTTEVTGIIANGRGPYFLELAGTSNPATLGTPLVVTYSANSGGNISVRGRNAYDL